MCVPWCLAQFFMTYGCVDRTAHKDNCSHLEIIITEIDFYWCFQEFSNQFTGNKSDGVTWCKYVKILCLLCGGSWDTKHYTFLKMARLKLFFNLFLHIYIVYSSYMQASIVETCTFSAIFVAFVQLSLWCSCDVSKDMTRYDLVKTLKKKQKG